MTPALRKKGSIDRRRAAVLQWARQAGQLSGRSDTVDCQLYGEPADRLRREYVSGIPPIAADEVYLKIDGRLVYLWRRR
jgi:hypothetical protein